MEYTTFIERARERAQNERHQARWHDQRLTVKSESEPGERYTQSFEILDTGALWFHCNCPSGAFRGHLLVPCKHATRWGDRMVRELGTAIKLGDGGYWLTESDDAFDLQASMNIAAATCAKRIVENLEGLDRPLTEQEQTEHDRLSVVLYELARVE